MASKTNTDIIKEIDDKILFYTSSFSKLIAFLEKHEQIEQFYKTINKNFTFNDISTFREQLNFAGYLTTMTLDLLVVSKGLIMSKHPWEKILHYRLGYTLIYEVISTYHNHLKINKLIRAGIVSNNLQKELSAIVDFLQILYKMQAVSTNLSETLFLNKEGELLNKSELMKDLHEKIERSLETTKQV